VLRYDRVTFTTTSGGAATVYSRPLSGLLHAIRYVYGDAATGADIVITDEATGLELLTITNAGTASTTHLPRGAAVGTTNAALLYAAGGAPVTDRLPVVSRIKAVVAQGGDTKIGTLVFVWEH